jgi:BolA protein
MSDTMTRIESALALLDASHLNIQDDSALHAGHAGNTGGGHYTLTIVSERFDSLSLLKRHRLVYEAVGTMMEADIHALSIKAFTPTEYHSR